MGLFDNFPFSNRHELNLDWILQTMKNALAQVEQGEQRIQDVIRGYVIPGQGVGTNELHDGAVTSPKLANSAVTADRIASGAVTSDKIVNGAVGSGKIPTGAIYGHHIRDHEVSLAKLGAFGAGNAGKLIAVGIDGNATLVEIDPDAGVVSVNGKSGVVILTAQDVGALPDSVVPISKGGTGANNVSGAVANLGLNLEQIWENASPTTAFVGGNIVINLADYSWILVTFRASTTTDNETFILYPKGYGHAMVAMVAANGSIYQRAVNGVSNGGISVGGGYHITSYGTTPPSDNTSLIPFRVYGVRGW